MAMEGELESLHAELAPRPDRARPLPFVPLIVVVWLVAVFGGIGFLWRYKATPGDPGAAPATFPAGTKIELARDRPTLIMFTHPRCSCSRASMSELEEIMRRAPGPVAAYVLHLVPEELPSWEDGELPRRAASIPGVKVMADRDGVEAHRFGLATSGHVVVYESDGRLAFSGGVTGSRGHVGDNVGRNNVLAALASGSSGTSTSAVFGCELDDPKEGRR